MAKTLNFLMNFLTLDKMPIRSHKNENASRIFEAILMALQK